jgi:hypothetical protein
MIPSWVNYFYRKLLLKAMDLFLIVLCFLNRMDLICGGLVHLPTPVAKNKESELMRSRFKFKDSPLTSFSRARDVVRVTRRQQEDIKIVFSSDKRILDERRKSREGYDDVAKMKKEGLKRATIMKKTGMRERDARVAFLERISAPGEIGSPQEEEAVARQDEKDLGALLGEKVQELLEADSGPPRWYSPVEAQICPDNAPLFLCLPGVCFFTIFCFFVTLRPV